jgi:hypothetical protein
MKLMQSAKRFLKSHWPIILLIVINMVIGLAVVRDYGQSWDEPSIYTYSANSIKAYSGFIKTGSPPYLDDTILAAYGPAFFMFSAILSKILIAFFPSWSSINGWHFSYFLSFQVGALSLYLLARRSTGKWAAFGAALLFATQPLLWGHAFINPKDIPFMAFFTASVLLGLYMADSVLLLSFGHEEPRSALVHVFRSEWDVSVLKVKQGAIAFFVVFISSTLFIVSGLSQSFIALLVTYAYQVDKRSYIGAWFAKMAPNAGQLAVSNYIHKAQVLFSYAEIIYILICILMGIWIFSRIFPLVYRDMSRIYFIPYSKRVLLNPLVLSAGFMLGLATSIRVLGPLAGGIVILYGLYKGWRKSVLFIPPYVLIAGFVTYLTWPYLWGNAARRFVESLATMSNFPWEGFILFQGKLLSGDEIPKYYLPYMISIQLTEIALILFVIGFVISIWRAFTKRQVEPLALIVVWLIFPIVGVIANRSTIYDSFRQFLFILPPVFLAGSLTLDSLFMKVARASYKGAILLLLVLPAAYMNVHLHPYQYIYYNSIVGGVRGAFHNYELDYWGTSYYESAEYINQVAPLGARVVVLGPIHLFQNYARPDLVIIALSDVNPETRYDYVVINGRKNEDLAVCRDVDAIKVIERDGAVLTAIKKVSSPEECVLSP